MVKKGYICINVKDLPNNNLELTYMRKIYLTLLAVLSLSSTYAQTQSANRYRKGDRIYFDSQDGHSGAFEWKMIKAGDVQEAAEKISQPGYVVKEWLPAIVPGTVLNSLVHNKVYPDPYYGLNNKLDKKIIPDLAYAGRDFYTYWFRTEFDVPESYKGKVVWLQLEGINYRAEVWVNGHLLEYMSGMFKPSDINVTEFVKVGEKNALAVKVYPVDMPGTTKFKKWGAAGEFRNGGDGNIGLNTTMLMSVGWDFTFLDGIRDRNTSVMCRQRCFCPDLPVIMRR